MITLSAGAIDHILDPVTHDNKLFLEVFDSEKKHTFCLSLKTSNFWTEKEDLETTNPTWKIFKLMSLGSCSMLSKNLWEDEEFMQAHGLE